MKHLKVSQILTSNYPYYKYSLDYALASLEKMGSNIIEFYACFPHFHIDDMDNSDLKILKQKLRHHHLAVSCFTPEQCLYPVNIAARCPRARQRSLEVFRKSIRFAAELESKLVVVLAGYGTLDEHEEDVWHRSAESLRILCEVAASYGVELVLETSPREYTTTHNAKDVVKMIREVQSPALKGMIDTATLGYSGEKMGEAIADLGSCLRHVHIADGVPNGHLVIGEGSLDLPDMLKQLDDIQYQGALSLEILNDRYIRKPEEAMEQSYQKLKQYLQG